MTSIVTSTVTSHVNLAETRANEVLLLLENAQTRGYIGEPVSQLEHALQCAKIAEDSGASDDFILAALFHDIGHLCNGPSDGPGNGPSDGPGGKWGIDDHHKRGAQFLRSLGFSENVCAVVEGHVDAKRFLVWQNPKYLTELSLASQETLKLQGGPMAEEEAKKFKSHLLFKEFLRLRTFDDRAKRVGWVVPSLSGYRNKILNHLILRSRADKT